MAVSATFTVLSDAKQIYLLDCQARGLSQHTIALYESTIRRFIDTVGDKPLDDVTPADVRAFMVTLAGGKRSTMRVQMSCIRCWFRMLIDEGLTSKNPALAVRMPSPRSSILPPYTEAELTAILAAKVTPRTRAILYLLTDTGVRARELLSMDVGDVDLASMTAIVKSGKGDKPRAVYFGATTAKHTLLYLAKRGKPRDGEPLLLNQHGRRLQYSGLQTLMNRLGKRLDIHVTAHRFRRTFAVTMLRNGADVYSLAMLMGHSDIKQLKPYLAIAGIDAKRAHSRFGVVENLRR